MDPLTAATTFATIVGLLCNYKQENQGQKDADHRLFIDWLILHKHNELADQITQQRGLTEEIDRLLREDHGEVMGALQDISKQIAQLSSSIGPLHNLARMVAPTSVLSDQAISLIRQLVESGGSEIGYIPTLDQLIIQIIGGGGLEISEPRFLEDDLDTLVSLGLLSPRQGSHGTRFYRITRACVALIERK